MKSRFLVTVGMLLLLSSGCFAPIEPTNNMIETTATVIATQPALLSPSQNALQWNYTPTLPSDFPNLTPIPTLSDSQQADLIQLLTSEVCNLPCYLGIEPGKTTFDEAEKLIIDFGGALRANYENFYEGYPDRSPLHLSTYILNLQDTDLTIYQDISIIEKDGKVQQIVFDASGNFQPLFYNAWAKYSIESILRNYGEPDQTLIYVGKRSYSIRAKYLDYGMIIEWTGSHDEDALNYRICPKFSKENVVSLMIAIADTKTEFEIVPSSYMGFEETYKSTQESLGISNEEFYEAVLKDSSSCFQTELRDP